LPGTGNVRSDISLWRTFVGGGAGFGEAGCSLRLRRPPPTERAPIGNLNGAVAGGRNNFLQYGLWAVIGPHANGGPGWVAAVLVLHCMRRGEEGW